MRPGLAKEDFVPTILDRIVATKREEIQRAKAETSEATLRKRLSDAPPTRDFLAALARPGPIHLIEKNCTKTRTERSQV